MNDLEKEKRQLQEEAAELKKENCKLKEKDRTSNEQRKRPGGKQGNDGSSIRILGEEEIEELEELEELANFQQTSQNYFQITFSPLNR